MTLSVGEMDYVQIITGEYYATEEKPIEIHQGWEHTKMPWHHFSKEESDDHYPRGGGTRTQPKCSKCGHVAVSQKELHKHKMDVHTS